MLTMLVKEATGDQSICGKYPRHQYIMLSFSILCHQTRISEFQLSISWSHFSEKAWICIETIQTLQAGQKQLYRQHYDHWEKWKSNKYECVLVCGLYPMNNKMKGQSEIAYLPKFADLYVKLKLEFLIASLICYIWAFDRFSSSNFDRAIVVQSLDLFWDLMTSSTKHSKIACKSIFIILWYLYTLSLKMTSLFVLQLSWKMLFYHS